MDPRIQIEDTIYFQSADGSKFIGLDDPTNHKVSNEKDYSENKLIAKLLKRGKITNFAEQCLFKVTTSKAKLGSEIRYGDKVCFMLSSAPYYLVQTNQSEEDMAYCKIQFQKLDEQSDNPKQIYPKPFCWKFNPLLKERKEGGFVYENDKITIQTLLELEGFLQPMINYKLASGMEQYDWKIKCFNEIGDIPKRQIENDIQCPIKAQEPITLFSIESQKYLGVKPEQSEQQSLTNYVEEILQSSSYTLQVLESQNQDNRNF